jgi:hypothetical protein
MVSYIGTLVKSDTTSNLIIMSWESDHHPSNKQFVLSTLVHRARALRDQDILHAELVFLKGVFRQNGYSDRHINRVLNRHPNISKTDDNPDSLAFLPYVGTSTVSAGYCPGTT